jgi:cell cycle arrest protein BUB3
MAPGEHTFIVAFQDLANHDIATQFELQDPPTDAISSLAFAPESTTRLLVSSWDKNVYLYEITPESESSSTLVRKFEHRAPVLDVCFGANDNEAFSAGLDWQVKRLDLESGEQTVLSSHEAAVKSVVYSKETNILISASWDCTLRLHFLSDPTKDPTTIPLPAKPFSLSLTPTKLVVGMAARLVHIYDLKSTAMLAKQVTPNPEAASLTTQPEIQPWQKRESSLKFMTRTVACMPNDAGYASSSIEGRVAVEWFDPSPESQARKYAFKCHRQPAPEGDGTDIVYPVNALAFHPVHGTFASGGGDGVVALWDAVAKRRIRQYQKYAASVAAVAFSSNGKYLAVGVCPGFEDGQEDYTAGGQTKIFIRELGETEAKGKGSK